MKYIRNEITTTKIINFIKQFLSVISCQFVSLFVKNSCKLISFFFK